MYGNSEQFVFCHLNVVYCFSSQTRDLIARGDIARANESSRRAKMLSILTLCIGLFLVLGVIVYMIVLFTVLLPKWTHDGY